MESINKTRKKTSIKTCVDSYDSNQKDVTSLEEAKNVIAELRARQKSQAHQMIQWKRALKYKVFRSYDFINNSSVTKFYPDTSIFQFLFAL